MPGYYEIKVKGHLAQRLAEVFAGLNFTALEGTEAVLSGLLSDQAALHGLIECSRDLHIPLISVTCSGRMQPQ